MTWNRWKALATSVTGAILLAGCAAKPVEAPRVVVPETVSSEIRVVARQADTFGNLTPIAVGVSSGAVDTYQLSADRILAVDAQGQRIAPLSLEEAARQAGGATELAAGLRGAGAGALLSGVLGAATGAILGAGTGDPGKGAAIGAGIGVAAGSIGGFHKSKTETERHIREQLGGLYFGEKELKTGLPANGFVFFPKGNYAGVRVIAIRATDEHVEEIFGPMTRD